MGINLKSNLKRNVLLFGETTFNPSIFSTLKKTLKMQKCIRKEMNLFHFLPTFMLLFGHAKLHKKRRLSPAKLHWSALFKQKIACKIHGGKVGSLELCIEGI